MNDLRLEALSGEGLISGFDVALVAPDIFDPAVFLVVSGMDGNQYHPLHHVAFSVVTRRPLFAQLCSVSFQYKQNWDSSDASRSRELPSCDCLYMSRLPK